MKTITDFKDDITVDCTVRSSGSVEEAVSKLPDDFLRLYVPASFCGNPVKVSVTDNILDSYRHIDINIAGECVVDEVNLPEELHAVWGFPRSSLFYNDEKGIHHGWSMHFRVEGFQYNLRHDSWNKIQRFEPELGRLRRLVNYVTRKR